MHGETIIREINSSTTLSHGIWEMMMTKMEIVSSYSENRKGGIGRDIVAGAQPQK